MLSPKRTKYRKAHKGRVKGVAKGGTALNFGAYRPKGGRSPARDHRAPDRGRPACHHPSYPASGPGVDPHLPGCAGVVRSRPRSAWARARDRRNTGCAG